MKKGAQKKHTLAVFDIDGTIFRSSLLIELVNGLVEDGVFPRRAKKEMEADYLAWLDRKGHYNNYIMQVVNIHLKYIKDCKQEDVLATAKRVISWQKDRVYRFTRDFIKELKGGGYYLVAISGSPDYIVKMFAKYMRFDASFGQVLEVKRGQFTGRVLNRDTIDNKEKVLREFVAKNGIRADLKKSIAVGDSEGDIPMLSSVGRPIAFNPSSGLADYARQKCWKIVVERKDVIYEIRDCILRNANEQ
jgi:HAD superfamily hydrolase (TIGR01490 family)